MYCVGAGDGVSESLVRGNTSLPGTLLRHSRRARRRTPADLGAPFERVEPAISGAGPAVMSSPRGPRRHQPKAADPHPSRRTSLTGHSGPSGKAVASLRRARRAPSSATSARSECRNHATNSPDRTAELSRAGLQQTTPTAAPIRAIVEQDTSTQGVGGPYTRVACLAYARRPILTTMPRMGAGTAPSICWITSGSPS